MELERDHMPSYRHKHVISASIYWKWTLERKNFRERIVEKEKYSIPFRVLANRKLPREYRQLTTRI